MKTGVQYKIVRSGFFSCSPESLSLSGYGYYVRMYTHGESEYESALGVESSFALARETETRLKYLSSALYSYIRCT